MHDDRFTRRTVLSGAVACGCTIGLAKPASAFLPAMLSGISALVTLWNGYKMAEELYERFFGENTKRVKGEVARFYTTQNFFIQNYYNFGNPYQVPGLGAAQPGCEAVAQNLQRNSTSLCCGTPDVPILIPMGCIIALHAAVNELQVSIREDNVFAYTRPIRYARPAAPMQRIGENQFASDVQYFSPAGSVTLGWLITDANRRTSRGQYRIRDDTSLRIVAVGETADFTY